MIKEHVFRSVLIMNCKLIDQGGTCFVHAYDLNLGAFTPKLDYNFIERADSRNVPEVRSTHVDINLVDYLLIIKDLGEAVCTREKYLPVNRVSTRPALIAGS